MRVRGIQRNCQQW
nr:truncated envelope glycoprotein [Human immunodeficiency virus 1]